MKKIIFVRHGRAEESVKANHDFERSLTTTGKNVSEQMAEMLRKKEQDTCIFISSPAFRAYETALVFMRIFEADAEKIILKSSLYNKTTLKTFADILTELPDDLHTAIFFGHNPAFTEIPDRMSKEGCDFLPKSGIVCLSFKKDKWTDTIHERGKIEYYLKPEKNL
jgi:phosphohistidine phosphatase